MAASFTIINLVFDSFMTAMAGCTADILWIFVTSGFCYAINLYIYFVVMWSIQIGTFLYYTNDSNWYLVMASIISMSFKSINTNNKNITQSRNSSNIQNLHRVPQYVMKLTHITFTETPICDGTNTHHIYADPQYMI